MRWSLSGRKPSKNKTHIPKNWYIVCFFPHEIFFLVHFNTKRYMYMYYIFAVIKKVSPYDKSYSSYM